MDKMEKLDFEPFANEPPPLWLGRQQRLLFHYTNFEGFKGIIDSEELHATSIHYLNDYKEFQDALETARSVIYELKLKTADQNQRDLFDKLTNRLEGIKKVYIHIFSFTTQGDLLSQWRAYCPLGGAAIAFDYEKLKQLSQTNNFWLRKCIYNDKEKRAIIVRLIDFIVQSFAKGIELEAIGNLFCKYIVLIAPCFKDKAFSEEQEWRLVSWLTPCNDKRMDVRIRNNRLFPYYRFSLKGLPDVNGKKDMGIGGYVVGPHNDKELISNALLFLIQGKNLYWQQSHYSSIPYRSF